MSYIFGLLLQSVVSLERRDMSGKVLYSKIGYMQTMRIGHDEWDHLASGCTRAVFECRSRPNVIAKVMPARSSQNWRSGYDQNEIEASLLESLKDIDGVPRVVAEYKELTIETTYGADVAHVLIVSRLGPNLTEAVKVCSSRTMIRGFVSALKSIRTLVVAGHCVPDPHPYNLSFAQNSPEAITARPTVVLCEYGSCKAASEKETHSMLKKFCVGFSDTMKSYGLVPDLDRMLAAARYCEADIDQEAYDCTYSCMNALYRLISNPPLAPNAPTPECTHECDFATEQATEVHMLTHRMCAVLPSVIAGHSEGEHPLEPARQQIATAIGFSAPEPRPITFERTGDLARPSALEPMASAETEHEQPWGPWCEQDTGEEREYEPSAEDGEVWNVALSVETLLQSLLPPLDVLHYESLQGPLSIEEADQTMIKQFASTLLWRKVASDDAAMFSNQDIYTYFQDLFKVRRLVQPDDFTELVAEECKTCHRLLFQQWRDEAKVRDDMHISLAFAQELRKRYGSKHFAIAFCKQAPLGYPRGWVWFRTS